MGTTTTEIDVVLMLVVLGLAALVVLSASVARALQPVRPSLPAEDCPPPGLGRLVPVGLQVEQECGKGLAQLELWLATTRRRRP